MTKVKRHHYVPRLLLRNFSADGRSINMFNIARRLHVPRASIGDQCYRNYFHGKDPKIERALGAIEANTQNVLRPLINSVAPGDQISSAQFYPLVRYTALQRARTSHAEAQAQEFVQHYVNAKSLEKGLPPGLLIATLENGVRGTILSALSLTPVLYDLGLSVLLADTPVKFVISDNPVVLRNQYWEQNMRFDRLGWSLQGLQIFFPISPNHLLLLYDRTTYKVGSRGHGQVVPIRTTRDVVLLNTLQWLNAEENIYFCPGQERHVMSQAVRDIPRRPNRKSEMVIDEGKHALTIGPSDQGFGLDFGFTSITRHPRRPIPDEGDTPVRNEHLAQIAWDFSTAVLRQTDIDFWEFVGTHPLARFLAELAQRDAASNQSHSYRAR